MGMLFEFVDKGDCLMQSLQECGLLNLTIVVNWEQCIEENGM